MNIFGQELIFSYHLVGYVVAALLVSYLCIAWRTYKLVRIAKQLVPDARHAFLLSRNELWRKIVKVMLYGVALLAVGAAFLQPQWGKKEEVVQQTGRDILIALDVSRSMLAQDAKPNRLEFAKQKIRKLLYNLSCERVGLLLFSGDCVVQCPFTSDYHAFFMFLDYVDAQTISSSSTAIDSALLTALDLFAKNPSQKTKIVCAFTDGEDFSAKLSGVKERAIAEKISLFAIGVGTEAGAPVPVLNKAGQQVDVEKDSQGAVVLSKLNGMLLKNLASACGGKYIASTESDDDIKKLVSYIEQFEKDQLDDKKVQHVQQQYAWPLAVAFLCLALEWII